MAQWAMFGDFNVTAFSSIADFYRDLDIYKKKEN